MKVTLSLTLLLLLFPLINAQQVETIISDPELRDGLHVDPEGNIYTSSGGFAGFEVGKYDIQTALFDPNFAIGFFGPVDVDQYRDSLLIVTNYDNNTVSAHNLNTSQSSIIATGLDGPSGIVIDAQDNIYVASWGNAPAYAGHQIHKISAAGQVSIFIDSPFLYRPQAMTTDLNGALIIHSNENLYKANLPDNNLEFWIDIGATIGHMAFRQKDSCIYATANNKVLKITPAGDISVFAGSSTGYQDGPIASAKFKSLLGIEFSPDEDTMYVCDSGYGGNMGRLRRIVMNPLVSTTTLAQKKLSIFPNPAQHMLTIDQGKAQLVKIEVFDVFGKLVLSKTERNSVIRLNLSALARGAYIMQWSDGKEFIVERFLRE